VDIEPYDGSSSCELGGTPDSTIPRNPRNVPVDELVLRDFDRGYYTMTPLPGDTTDEDDAQVDDIIERSEPPPTLR
jgi:hypothetical protein